MSFETRRPLIQKIESLRKSKVICYVTSLRPGVEGRISDDAVREIIDHIQRIAPKGADKIDLFLVSNGGDGVVPWRLIPLLREYSKKIGLLVPYKAYSAATIMALGADEIVMHPFGVLGPIDPTVTNEFNPIEIGTNRKLGISVEDVKAYISFIKETVGIKHEEELVRVIEILANKVHPLALGNVERFLSQSRLIATKLLQLHTDQNDHHKLDSIIEVLTSKFFFHGHPINRVEAKEIGLRIVESTTDLTDSMWALFSDFENEMKFKEHFEPFAELTVRKTFGTPGLFSEIAQFETDLKWAIVESSEFTSQYDQRIRYVLNSDPQLQTSMSAISLSQRWNQIEPELPPEESQLNHRELESPPDELSAQNDATE